MKSKLIFSAVLMSAVTGIAGCMTPLPPVEAVSEAGDNTASYDLASYDLASYDLSNYDLKTEYAAFFDYLKSIYKNADEYIDGFPVYYGEIDKDQTFVDSLTLYKEFAILDLDKDGKEELIICAGKYSKEHIKKKFFQKTEGETQDGAPDRDEALENLTDMFILCEENEDDYVNKVSEGKDTVMLGTRGGLTSDEVIFLSNGCVVTEADEKLQSRGVKYDKVGLFNKALCEEMGVGHVSGTYYIGYEYNDTYERKEYEWYQYGNHDLSHTITLADEAYERQLSVTDSGDVVEISKSDCRDFTASGIGISEEEVRKTNKPEDDVFLKYLADIYNKYEIINGYPVEIVIDEESAYDLGSWVTYKNFSIADFDGDGTNELLIQKYGPYNGGMTVMNNYDSFTELIYPYFDMYEISETGEVKDRDEEPYTIHGDLWLGGIRQPERHNFEFFDNAVFRYRGQDTDNQDSECYYIYDDDIYRQLEQLGHRMYTEYEGIEPWVFGSRDAGSAVCYTREKDGTIRRKVGSHQDASYDAISEEDYRTEVNILTGGNKLETAFKKVNAEALSTALRSDTFENNVCSNSDTGLSDITLTGSIYTDITTKDAAGNPEPAVVLKLDKGFAYMNADYRAVRVDEVQLGADVSVRDTLDFKKLEGRKVSVTGSTFAAITAHHHRPLIMLVKEAELR